MSRALHNRVDDLENQLGAALEITAAIVDALDDDTTEAVAAALEKRQADDVDTDTTTADEAEEDNTDG